MLGGCGAELYNSHKDVLENPDRISRTVLEKGLEAGTAFEILSIDIADVDVGRNVGAQLQTEQAEADKQIAQAKAEERKAMATAVEQEMKARVQEMRAKVVEAEAEIPQAMAAALRNGNIGVMDYYNMLNVQADTEKNTLAFARFLSDNGKKMWIRQVIVPGITDEDESLQRTRSFIDSLKTVEKVEVLPYHTMGTVKYEKLGLEYPLKDVSAPTKERVLNAKRILCEGLNGEKS